MGAVDDHPIQGRELPDEGVKQGLFLLGIHREGAAHSCSCRSKAGNGWGSLRAAAVSVFLPAAQHNGGKDLSRGLIYRAPTLLGAVNLVGGDAD